MFAVPAFFLLVLTTAQAAPPSTADRFAVTVRQAEEAKSSNHLSQAVKLYSEALRLRPAWSEGWWSLASLLYEQERFAEAQVAFTHFTKVAPKPGPAYAFLALCEYETQEYDLALHHFQTWSKSGSPGSDALIDVAGYHWALLLIRQGEFQPALYLLAAKTAKLGPSPNITEAMGLASLRMTNLPSDYPREKREMVWLAGKAADYAALNEQERSGEYAKRLEERYPQEPNVHYFLGTLWGFQSKWPEATKEYEKELQINPTNVPALTELAVVRLRTYEPEKALPLAKKAVELDPNSARALYALGKSLLDTNHARESIPELEAAKKLAPRSGLIRSALASAYRKTGQIEAGKREAAAFLALKDKEELLGPMEPEKPATKKAEAHP